MFVTCRRLFLSSFLFFPCFTVSRFSCPLLPLLTWQQQQSSRCTKKKEPKIKPPFRAYFLSLSRCMTEALAGEEVTGRFINFHFAPSFLKERDERRV